MTLYLGAFSALASLAASSVERAVPHQVAAMPLENVPGGGAAGASGRRAPDIGRVKASIGSGWLVVGPWAPAVAGTSSRASSVRMREARTKLRIGASARSLEESGRLGTCPDQKVEWREQDSNLRRLSQRIYSPSPLTARESRQ